MHSKKILPILTLLIVAAFSFVPIVVATPIPVMSNFSWNSYSGFQGTTFTATFGVPISIDGCPAGDTFNGTLSVREPDISSLSSFSVTNVPCGTTDLTAVYPTDFTGVAGTNETGSYHTQWGGSTSLAFNGIPIQNGFGGALYLSISRAPIGAPEFAAPSILVAAMGLVLLALMKKTRILRL